MFKKLSQKYFITFYIIIICVMGVAVIGCTANSNKRGIIFRGDWAFEINRTPWVGHSGNTDIPDSENEQKSDCTKGKNSTLANSLLGPLSALKSKCHCKNCTAASATGTNGNINITSYNPTIANTFPNPFTPAFHGSVPPGSLSLPPGAVVVPNGVFMPNGTILPHYLFFPQQASSIQHNPPFPTSQPLQNHSSQENIQPPQNPQEALNSSRNIPNPSPPSLSGQVSGQSLPSAPPTSAVFPVTLPHGTGNSDNRSQTNETYAASRGNIANGLTSNGGAINDAVANGYVANGLTPPAPGAPTVSGISPNATAYSAANTTFQQSANPMMVNPVDARAIPGLTMTGLSLPGYPPIGYAPTGYSPGYAQPIYAPPITGPLGGMSEQNTAANTPRTKKAENNSDDAESPPKNVAQMPYPRFHPTPLHPVYQRRPGLVANYGAIQQSLPPQNPTMRTPQEQRLMLERQRQAMLWQQQIQQQQARWREFSYRDVGQESVSEEENNASNAPEPPTSKILLANHQTPILQTVAPNVGTAKYINRTTGKNVR
ncbi:MAG: hypothetical protein LBT05_08960 [Planctomycetaceae bacterium]|nr:hypothetical protein [Planctomycetaceae bacterium]